MTTAALKTGSPLDVAALQASTNVVTAALTGGSSNDYNPTGMPAATHLLIKVSTATQFLTGIVSGARVGRNLSIMCDAASTFNLVLKNLDSGSSANNRFNMGGDLTLKPGQGMSFVWEAAVSGGSAGWRPIASAFGLDGLLAQDNSTLDINTTASKTTVFSFTVPAGTLGTNNSVRVEVAAELQNSTGSTQVITPEVSYGGTVMWTDPAAAQASVGTATLHHPIYFEFLLSGANATNAQKLGGQVSMSAAVAATTGQGDLGAVITNSVGFDTPITGTAAVDSTADQTFTVSITLAASSATLKFIRLQAVAYIVGKGAKGDPGTAGPTGAGSVNALSISSGVANIDCSLGDYFTLALSADVTSITFTNLPASGLAKTMMVKVTQNASAAKTVAFPSSFKWAGGTTGVVSTGLSAVDVLALTSFDQGTTWIATLAKAFA